MAKRVRVRLSENEWNFDRDRVSDAELVACCLWEYARESAMLTKLRKQCEDACRADGNADSLVPIVAGNIRHPHNAVELFLREIVLQCPYDIWQSVDQSKLRCVPQQVLGNGFPAPWQSLCPEERARRAGLIDLKGKPYVAFQRGRLRDAQSIVHTVLEQRKVALNPKIDPLAVSWIATHSPLVESPVDWTDEGRLPGRFSTQMERKCQLWKLIGCIAPTKKSASGWPSTDQHQYLNRRIVADTSAGTGGRYWIVLDCCDCGIATQLKRHLPSLPLVWLPHREKRRSLLNPVNATGNPMKP